MGADLMSRQYRQAFVDIEDYQLTDDAFDRLQRIYGKFNRDMFANAENTKCPLYVSRYADACGISTRALEHILNQPDARGLLILPLWVRLNSYSTSPRRKPFYPPGDRRDIFRTW